MKTILVLHGPNLNLLGSREPSVYGHITLDEINNKLQHLVRMHGANLLHFQSNSESALVDRVHLARQDGTDFIVINPLLLRIPVWLYAMHWRRWPSHLLKCIFPMCLHVNRSQRIILL